MPLGADFHELHPFGDDAAIAGAVGAGVLDGTTRATKYWLRSISPTRRMLRHELTSVCPSGVGCAFEVCDIGRNDRSKLASDEAGRSCHFRRDRRFAQVQVVFTAPEGVDPNPGRELTDQLRELGWTWRSNEPGKP
jgi:hypothetical protein